MKVLFNRLNIMLYNRNKLIIESLEYTVESGWIHMDHRFLKANNWESFVEIPSICTALQNLYVLRILWKFCLAHNSHSAHKKRCGNNISFHKPFTRPLLMMDKGFMKLVKLSAHKRANSCRISWCGRGN